MEFQDLCTVKTSISPFPHGTCSLSVRKKPRSEGGPPIIKQDTHVPLYVYIIKLKNFTGLAPSMEFQILLYLISLISCSLTTINDLSVDL